MNALKSFLLCSGIHMISSNTVSCITFQLYFIYKALSILYNTTKTISDDSLKKETLCNLNSLYGYFIYDILYLLYKNNSYLFIIHHIIGMTAISKIKQFGAPSELLWDYNLFCFVAEVTNPFLNLRQLRYVKENPMLKNINNKLILITYTIFRIILFPILSKRLYNKIKIPLLLYLFSVIYIMSIIWFIRMFNGCFLFCPVVSTS